MCVWGAHLGYVKSGSNWRFCGVFGCGLFQFVCSASCSRIAAVYNRKGR